MSKKVQIMGADEARESTARRKSPAQLILESLEGNYKTMTEIAKMMGVHVETMRRLCRATDEEGNPRIKAPSQAVRAGGMTIYLFTEEDVQEVKAYFTARGYVVDA